MDFKQEIISLLRQHTSLSEVELQQLLAVPPNPALGDYAFPCFKLGKNPKEAADSLQQKLKLPSSIAKTQVVGPYLNFFVNKSFLARQTFGHIEKEKQKYGSSKSGRNILVEYCGPNTNKPLHLGHLRNMSLGLAVCNLLAFQGHKIHPVNIVNDRGVHICQSMLAYQKWGNKKKPSSRKQGSSMGSTGKKGDHFVGDYYVMFAKAAKEEEKRGSEALKKEAQEMLLKWELGDKATRQLWKTMTQWVLKGFKETYKRFGVKFEKEYFESQYYKKGKEVIEEGLKKNVFVKDHTAAVIAPLEPHGLPNKVLLRGDDTSLYITQDLYLAQLRYADYHYDKLIYVVASEQQLHFKQLFKILELLGRPYARNLYHLSYGLVNLPTGRMKSREGTVVDADDLMDEVSRLAKHEVEKRYPDLAEKEKTKRAEFIALGALKFFLVRVDPTRDMIYNPEESISFEGETGPYVQYTHARACSILRKAKRSISAKSNVELLNNPLEEKVISLLAGFPGKVKEAAELYKPHILCHYLLELAQAFNEFYHALPVISEAQETMDARLLLVDSVRQVLANGLTLLGIHAPKEM